MCQGPGEEGSMSHIKKSKTVVLVREYMDG